MPLPSFARPGNKYHARKTEVDGVVFDSAKEARRYYELRLLERAGEIADLKLQHKFPLSVGDVVIGHYIADFTYTEYGVERFPRKVKGFVVEDVKGFKTPLYRWKKRHFEAQHGIQIREI